MHCSKKLFDHLVGAGEKRWLSEQRKSPSRMAATETFPDFSCMPQSVMPLPPTA